MTLWKKSTDIRSKPWPYREKATSTKSFSSRYSDPSRVLLFLVSIIVVLVALNLSVMEVDPRKTSTISDPFAEFYKAVQTYGSFLPDVS